MGDPDGSLANWISGAALFVSLGVVGLGYLRRRPVVPAAAVDELRQENADLRERLRELRDDNSRLRSSLGDALARSEFWQEQFRRLKDRAEKG